MNREGITGMRKVIVHPLTEHTNVILVLSVKLKVHVFPSAKHFNYTAECGATEHGIRSQTNKTETR